MRVSLASLVVSIVVVGSTRAHAEPPLGHAEASAPPGAAEASPRASAPPEPSAPDLLEEPAASEPPVALGLTLGAATALIPFGTGLTIVATAEDRDVTLAALFVGEGGLVAAPLVAHGVVGEWGRGLRFSIYPAIGAAFLGGLVVARPSIVTSGLSTPLQYAFVLSIGETLFASSLGVWDVTGAPARQKRDVHVGIAPLPLPGGGGLRVGGTW